MLPLCHPAIGEEVHVTGYTLLTGGQEINPLLVEVSAAYTIAGQAIAAMRNRRTNFILDTSIRLALSD
jgi:hypothetical protein